MSTHSGTGNRQPATGDARRLTGDWQPATGNGNRPGRDLRIGADIAGRLLDLAAAVVRIVKTLPKDVSGRHIASQRVRAATAGGANYEEARAAESRADFVHKVGVAAKEIREAIFWVRLIERSAMTSAVLGPVVQEAAELAAILSSSARTARARINDDK
jgi:four helix bundle protein